MAVTIRDVARKAGVSIGTVSRVINGVPGVKPASRERIENAVRVLGYRPNARARSLARNASAVLSFVVSNRELLHPFHSRILQGVARQCEESGYFVLYSMFQYSPEIPAARLELPGVLRSHGLADCVILAGTNYPNLVEALDTMGIPFVLLANNYLASEPRPPVDQVRFDDVRGGYEAARYLIELGHRDIWYIGDAAMPWYRNRHQGYVQAMKEAGLEPRAQTVGLSDDRFTNGLRCGEIVARQGPVTAILAGTDDVAHGAWEALAAAGLRVPEDVSLVGFDDQRGSYRGRELTTVRVEAEDIGRQLAKMAIERTRRPGAPLPEVLIPVRLVKRGSCRPLGELEERRFSCDAG